MGAEEYRGEFADHARLLAAAGVDVMLPEYVGFIADCVTAVDACATVDLPVFLGVHSANLDAGMRHGESLHDLVASLEGHRVDAILLMCCFPAAISAGLPVLREVYDGPIGGYPNIGYAGLAPIDASRGKDLNQNYDYPPSRMAQFAGQWLEMGAQIVGGCCATGPEHILAMATVVKGR